jgi:cytochrome c551/c552
MRSLIRAVGVVGVLICAGRVSVAQATAQLAFDQGCQNCHGSPPRKSAPTFEQLATRYARYQGQPDAVRVQAGKLREGSFLNHIAAHERLSPEDAEALVRWLIEGAK